MIEKKSETGESKEEFALSMILTNILLLAVIAALFQFIFYALNQSHLLNEIVHGRFLP